MVPRRIHRGENRSREKHLQVPELPISGPVPSCRAVKSAAASRYRSDSHCTSIVAEACRVRYSRSARGREWPCDAQRVEMPAIQETPTKPGSTQGRLVERRDVFAMRNYLTQCLEARPVTRRELYWRKPEDIDHANDQPSLILEEIGPDAGRDERGFANDACSRRQPQ